MQAYLWTILVSLLLVEESAAQLLVEQCGAPLSSARIMNGKSAEWDAAAWMAGIRNKTHFQCGGTVIHRRFVLTAAHCIEGQSSLFVMLGAYNISRPTLEYSVSRGIMHHGYSARHLAHDIGLLQLARNIQFSEDVYPICIILSPLMKSKVEKLYTFNAYGWGRTKTTGISDILQKVTLDHYDRSHCDAISYTPLTSNQICAGSPNGDTCQGDSGGPLTRKISVNNIERQTQLGIVSFGSVACDGEGIYTDVSSYAGWIKEKVNQYSGIVTSPQRAEPESRSRPPPEFASYPTPNPRIPKNYRPRPPRRPTFLYIDCRGDNIGLNLLVKIFGPDFERNGVMITDRYVLTTAKDLPSEARLLDVGIASTSTIYEEYPVQSVTKHPNSTDDYKHDIALLKLAKSVSLSGRKKPVCMLLEATHFEEGNYPKLTIFDYHRSTSTTPSTTTIIRHVVEPVFSSECSTRIDGHIEKDQLCMEERANMTEQYGKTGDIMGALMRHSGRNWYILVGIVSYSTKGMHVLTNVMNYINWIEGVVGTY